jgi:cell division protein ZapA (FtsZ GTPase activity inhibitor)
MNPSIRRVKVALFGETYTLLSDEPEGRITEAVRLVDSLMRDFSARSSGVESRKLALLVALTTAIELRKTESFLSESRECTLRLVRRIDEETSEIAALP